MEAEELRKRIQRGEDETLEIKAAVPSPDVIAHHLASFANTKGGLLVFGVKEPATFVGVNVHRSKAMLKAAQSYLAPNLQLEIESHVIDGHPVVVAVVPAARDLVSARGGYPQ